MNYFFHLLYYIYIIWLSTFLQMVLYCSLYFFFFLHFILKFYILGVPKSGELEFAFHLAQINKNIIVNFYWMIEIFNNNLKCSYKYWIYAHALICSGTIRYVCAYIHVYIYTNRK